MVGTEGRAAQGALLLCFYSLGLAVPRLAVAASHLVQSRIRAVAQYETLVRWLSDGILVAFGLYSLIHGNVAF